MTNFIPVFPIDAIIYPTEIYRLHIAEDNYKHLITDCYGDNKPFGVLPILNDRVSEIGTLVEIVEVKEVWEDGRMNILVKGISIFKTLEIVKNIPEKLYSGAIVSHLNNSMQPNPMLTHKVHQLVAQFHYLINYAPPIDFQESNVTSYDIAHNVGLSLQEEFEVLELLFESQRYEYIRRHLLKIIPILSNIQSMLKRNAKVNDFKNPKGFDLGS